MHFPIHYGRQQLDLDLPDDRSAVALPAPEALADPVGVMQSALENPFEYPALRRALTPDDEILIVVDPAVPQLDVLLPAVLEPITTAHVAPEAITLLLPPGADSVLMRSLREPIPDLRVEVHDPSDRGSLAYLASTAAGRRIYLNRRLVDASQSVVLSACRYDPLLGYAGGEGAIYPGLSDTATLNDVTGRVNFSPPDAKAPWPTLQEAVEVAWLVGQPFYIQVIPGPADRVAGIIAGAGAASAESRRLLDAAWRTTVPKAFDVVIATLRGDPARHTFSDLAAAAGAASRVVRPGGRVVLLTEATPVPGPGTEILRQEDEPREALRELLKKPTLEHAAAIQWTEAACHARLALLSGLKDDFVEELYATPLTGPGDVARLASAGGSVLILEDANLRIVNVA
jgi:nickel-dependent lactate racemase